MAKKESAAKAAAPETAVPPEEIQASGEALAPETAQEASQAVPGPEPIPKPFEPAKAVVRAGNGLNLRAGPGPGFEAYEVLPDGMEVSVLTLLAEGGPQGTFDFRVPGWKYIFTGQKVGWVDARFLELSEAGHGVP